MKGQLSIYGLLMTFISLWLFLAILYPGILAPTINTFVLYLQANPTDFSDFMIILAQLSPVMFLLSILLTVWVYATPRIEQALGG